jgi:3',5'-cyclic AMP phosphodiesterase CpdA
VAAAQARAPFALAVVPGDNLYECGPDASRPGAEACAFAEDGNTLATPPLGDDPLFARLHEVPLASLTGPVYLALGNHDVSTLPGCGTSDLGPRDASRLKACLEVAHRSARWSMPARHYVVDEGPARFVVIDSNAVYEDYGGFTIEDELAFVAEAVVGCARKACFLVGHHPPVTAGEHVRDFDATRTARMARLLAAAGPEIRAMLAGHDHDLQHLRTSGGLDVLVSGNGAKARDDESFQRVNDGGQLLFASVRPGLGVLAVHPAGWSYRFEDVAGRPLYCCAARGAGRCEAIRCGPVPGAVAAP